MTRYGYFVVRVNTFDEYEYKWDVVARNGKAAIQEALKSKDLGSENDIVGITAIEYPQCGTALEKSIKFQGRTHLSERGE